MAHRSKFQSWQRRAISELDRKMLALIAEHWRAGHPIDRDSAEFELVQQGHPYQEVHQIISGFVNQTPVLLFDPKRPVPYLAGLIELGEQSSDEDLEQLAVLMETLRKLYHPSRRELSDEEVSQRAGLPLEVVQRLASLTPFRAEQGFRLNNEILGWETFDDFLDQQLPRPIRMEQDLPDLHIDFLPSALRWANLGPYREAELELSPLTVLVGANAAGKTSILKVIQGIRALAEQGPRVFEPAYSYELFHLPHRNAAGAEISVSGELLKQEHRWANARWSANLSLKPRATVQRELLQLGQGLEERVVELERGIGYWAGEDGRPEPLHLRGNQLALREAIDSRRHAALIAIRQSVQRWHAEHEPVSDEAELYQLLDEGPQEELQEMVEAVLGSVRVQRRGANWFFIDRHKHETPLFHAPRGIRQVVAILGRLQQKNRPTLMAFDEIENHLHADVVERLLDVMRGYTDRTRILLTTHSGNVLRSMAPSEVRLVRIGADGSRIVRVDRDPTLSQLAQRGDMAKLLEDGYFARSL